MIQVFAPINPRIFRWRTLVYVVVHLLSLFIMVQIWVVALRSMNTAFVIVTALITLVTVGFWLSWMKKLRRRLLEEELPGEFADPIEPDETLGNLINGELARMRLRMRGVLASGLSEEHINSLPVHTYKRGAEYDASADDIRINSSNQEDIVVHSALASSTMCSVCLSEYVEGDSLISLSCQHSYHADCIKTWLRIKSICPYCKQLVFSEANPNGAALVDDYAPVMEDTQLDNLRGWGEMRLRMHAMFGNEHNGQNIGQNIARTDLVQGVPEETMV